jgi:hypothetical protein
MNNERRRNCERGIFIVAGAGGACRRSKAKDHRIGLAEQLGIRAPEGWYAVTWDDFNANAGSQFLKHYNGSPVQAVMAYIPSYPWKQWLFSRVPFHFWDQPGNRRRYMQWLGKQLGFRKAADWRRVRGHHFRENGGAGLVARYGSHLDVLEEHLPEIDWAEARRGVAG